MSADTFVVYYGLRFAISDREEVDLIERRAHPKQTVARKEGLRTYFGVPTMGQEYFLLVGTEVGIFGITNKMSAVLLGEAAGRITDDTRRKLKAAGFDEEPAFHFQVVAGY